MKLQWIGSIILLLKTGTLFAATVALDFSSLPSSQGWTYWGRGLAEPNVHSVNGTTLTLNTLGAGSTYAFYEIDNIVLPPQPFTTFTLSMRARVLQSEEISPGGFAHTFDAFATVGGEFFGIGLTPSALVPYGTQQFLPLDGTQFHDYRVEAVPGVGISIFVDSMLVYSQRPPLGASGNDILFGNISTAENGLTEITQFSFVQVPEPGSLVFIAGGCALLAMQRKWIRRPVET